MLAVSKKGYIVRITVAAQAEQVPRACDILYRCRFLSTRLPPDWALVEGRLIQMTAKTDIIHG